MFKSSINRQWERAENQIKAFLFDMARNNSRVAIPSYVAKQAKMNGTPVPKNRLNDKEKPKNVIEDPDPVYRLDKIIKEIGVSLIAARAELMKVRMDNHISDSDFDSCKSRVDQIEKHVLKIRQRLERETDEK